MVGPSYLRHPQTGHVYRCRVWVGWRGLYVARLGDGAARTSRRRSALVVPWRDLQGLDADGTATAPGGGTTQVLAVATGSGTLSLLVPAPDLAVLLGAVGRRARRWRHARSPVASATRQALAAGRPVLAKAFVPFVAVAALVAAPLRRWAPAVLAPFLTLRAALTRSAASRLVAVITSVVLVAATLITLVVSGPVASGTSSASGVGRFDPSSMAGILRTLGGSAPVHLKPAAAPPAPAPPSLVDQPPLRPHEVFGFAPYWTLAQSGSFDLAKVTTLAYFGLGVNPDGTLDESGSSWNGYESQALADLVTRAHGAGDRVVLTVDCFDQRSLDQLTSSPTAPATLSAALIGAVRAKNLDGVNLDFEGQGAADRAGLTDLVAQVSTALHAADPHWQVTVDTYASSAGDPNGFYDVAALAPWVDGFFVMAYQLNLQARPSAMSPLTSPMFSDVATAAQYASVVPPSKVVLGLPFYGYEWPTTDGTLSALATGPAQPVAYAQIAARGTPWYWDPVTDTAWTSYRVGTQWYEDFFENPYSLYLLARLAQQSGFAGVGAWALGMDGNAPAMLSALDGLAPPAQDLGTGPLNLPTLPSPQVSSGTPTTTTGSSTTTTGSSTTTTGSSTTTTGSSTTTSTAAPPTPSQVSTGATAGGSSPTTTGYQYTGTWSGQQVTLTKVVGPTPTTSSLQPAGSLTAFHTNDPALACLGQQASLPVWANAAPSAGYLVVATAPPDCAAAAFSFVASSTSSTTTSTTAAPSSSG